MIILIFLSTNSAKFFNKFNTKLVFLVFVLPYKAIVKGWTNFARSVTVERDMVIDGTNNETDKSNWVFSK